MGSYLRLADVVYHPTLGLRVIKIKRRHQAVALEGLLDVVLGTVSSFLEHFLRAFIAKKCHALSLSLSLSL